MAEPGDETLTQLGPRDWTVIAGALTLLAASFKPWYGTTVAYSGVYGSGSYSSSASAWRASSLWSAAVLLGVVAAVLWLSYRPGSGWRGKARWIAAAALVVAVGLVCWQTVRIWDCSAGCHTVVTLKASSQAPPEPGEPGSVGSIQRNRLSIHHGLGFDADVRSGLYVGFAALAVMLIAAATTLLARRFPSPVADAGTDTG
jgi:hypothetical protein